MRRGRGWIGRTLAVLALLTAVFVLFERNEIRRLWAVLRLFHPDVIVSNFSAMDTMFLSREMDRGSEPVSPLPRGEPFTLPAQVQEWVTDRSLTSLLILHDGKVVFEEYYQGTGPEDRRISWSMAKSWLSVLYGILLDEGAVPPLDAQVVDYLPQMKGSAYDGVSVLNLMQMSSGMKFNEDYLDFWSDINKMGRLLAIGGSLDKFAAGRMERLRPPGEAMEYNSIDTHVIGMVMRAATGRSAPELMQEKLVAPLGMEQGPYYLVDSKGSAFVLGGLNMRTRDYARFGQMILQDGEWQGRQVVPRDWIRLSTASSAKTAPGERQYGYQWWLPEDALPYEFMTQGVYGQNIYFDRRAQVVIVRTSGDRRFREDGTNAENAAIFRQISEALRSR